MTRASATAINAADLSCVFPPSAELARGFSAQTIDNSTEGAKAARAAAIVLSLSLKRRRLRGLLAVYFSQALLRGANAVRRMGGLPGANVVSARGALRGKQHRVLPKLAPLRRQLHRRKRLPLRELQFATCAAFT